MLESSCQSWKFWKRWSWTFYLQLHNPGGKSGLVTMKKLYQKFISWNYIKDKNENTMYISKVIFHNQKPHIMTLTLLLLADTYIHYEKTLCSSQATYLYIYITTKNHCYLALGANYLSL